MFEWDHGKARTNLQKHGVSFDEAATVFEDPLAAILPDHAHSHSEVREIIVGYSITERLLVVTFTERENGTLGIVSARMAAQKERHAHETYRKG